MTKNSSVAALRPLAALLHHRGRFASDSLADFSGIRNGRQEGRSVSDTEWQSESQAAGVSARDTQGAATQSRDWTWVEATVWNERMLAALGNGVRGGKWFSLIDKVYRQQTLKAAWHKVKSNAGASGIDGQSVKQFGCGHKAIWQNSKEPLSANGNETVTRE